ncbi:MAG: recombination protein RecR [Bdellovibrionales bacterium]|nr:recombination protein RecR [Bdellovibrionales bacterium]
MSYQGPESFRKAVVALAKLPGVGEKTAQRLIFHLMKGKKENISFLTQALEQLKAQVTICAQCFGYSDTQICPVCTDVKRDQHTICVVEEPSDVFAIERSGHYRGVYHVLHGVLAPLDGVGPSALKIKELFLRAQSQEIKEVLIATNPNVEGDATALYLAQGLRNQDIPVSRIAMGLPMGGHLEYADRVTLARAIAERRDFSIR